MPTDSHLYQLFDRLFEVTRDKLYAFVLKHTRNQHETEDILQHCYMKLWEHLDQVDTARIDNLLFTYARNAIIDQVRKKKAAIVLLRPVDDDANISADHISAEQKMDYDVLNQKVGILIDRLPPKRKQVFLLVREQGLSYEEVSEQLGISKLTIKQHMNEALRFLREEAGKLTGPHYAGLSILLFLYLR